MENAVFLNSAKLNYDNKLNFSSLAQLLLSQNMMKVAIKRL